MNKVEKALIHALFIHLHHNIDKAIDFQALNDLNKKIGEAWPDTLVVGPQDNDDAAVVRIPGEDNFVVAKQESHCSPCVPRPYDSAATGAGGAIRDVVAMGGKPIFILDFIGTRPLEEKVLVGPCAFEGKCSCGNCIEMKSQERLNLMLKGIKDMCEALNVFIAGGGLSTSFRDIVPAVVVAVVGKLVTQEPLTKPAKKIGDKLVIIGDTNNDGNDTLFRAGLVSEMLPAEAVFEEEKITLNATLEVFKTGKINACSDLGAAGIGAAVCESARFGGLGAKVDLANVPLKKKDITPEEILICETQGRMIVQTEKENTEEVINAARSMGANAEIIGEITGDDKAVFEYGGQTIATIPNAPSREILEQVQ